MKNEKKEIINFDNIGKENENLWEDNDVKIQEQKQAEIYQNKLNKLESFLNNNLLTKWKDIFLGISIIKKINKNIQNFDDFCGKTKLNYKVFELNNLKIINFTMIFIILLLVILFINLSFFHINFYLIIVDIKTKIHISFIIILIYLYYVILKLINSDKIYWLVNFIFLGLVLVNASLLAIFYFCYSNDYANFSFIIIGKWITSIWIITNLLSLFNYFNCRIFGKILGEFLYYFGVFSIFLYSYIFFLDSFFQWRNILFVISGLYISFLLIKLSHYISIKNNSHEEIIIYLKNKKKSSYFNYYFDLKYINEIYHSILPIINFILIALLLNSILVYILRKINIFLENKDEKNLYNILFIKGELVLFLFILINTIIFFLVYEINRIIKIKSILFITIKFIIVFCFIFIFNFENIIKIDGQLLDLNKVSTQLYFYFYLICLSLIPIFDKKWINLNNTLKFSIFFSFSVFSIYFLFNKKILNIYYIIILTWINYSFFIFLIVRIMYKYFVTKIENIENVKYFLSKIFLSYIYDIFLIYIMNSYLKNISNKKRNNIYLVYFIYCILIYIITFVGNAIKYQANYNLNKEKFISKVLDKIRNSKIVFIITCIIIILLYIVIMSLYNLFNISHFFHIITFYTFYIWFIWITFNFFVFTLKTNYKKYIYLLNLTVLILYTLPFCLLTTIITNIYINKLYSINIVNILNIFLLLIIICFSLWGVIISLSVNIMISKIEYEKMNQYICWKLKIDCYQKLIFADINELKILFEEYLKYNDKKKFISFLQNGKFLIWWEDKKLENYKKKLVLKEDLEIFLKTINENYENKPSIIEKLLCIKVKKIEQKIEIETKSKNKEDILNNLVNKFKKEKEEKFWEEYEEIEIKKLNYKIFKKFFVENLKDIDIKKKHDNSKLLKLVYLNINNKVTENKLIKDYNTKINKNKSSINLLENKKNNIEKIVYQDLIEKENEIINETNKRINEQLELYKNKDKLLEILKISEKQRKFFLYIIYYFNSTKNNNNTDEKSLSYKNFIEFFKKIRIGNMYMTNFKINILNSELFDIKNIFLPLANIKKGSLDDSEFNKFLKTRILDKKKLFLIGIDFENFCKFYEKLAIKLSEKIDNYSDDPKTKLIWDTYSLCKYSLYDFEKIIKNINMKKYNNDEKNKIKNTEMRKINRKLNNINTQKIQRKKEIETKKIELDKEIENHVEYNKSLFNLKIKEIRKSKINLDTQIMKVKKQKHKSIIKPLTYKFEDVFVIKKMKRIKKNLLINNDNDVNDKDNNEDKNNDKKLIIKNDSPNLDDGNKIMNNKNNDIKFFSNNTYKDSNNGSILKNSNKYKGDPKILKIDNMFIKEENNYIDYKLNSIKNKNKFRFNNKVTNITNDKIDNNNNSINIKTSNSMLTLNSQANLINIKNKKTNNNPKLFKKINEDTHRVCCFCFKIKDKKKTKDEKKFYVKVYDFIKEVFYSMGFKNTEQIVDNPNINKNRSEPENWKKFSEHLTSRIEYHKDIYDKIIYTNSILLNFTNISFIFSRIIGISGSYIIFFDDTYPWFNDSINTFTKNESSLFFFLFPFKFGVSFTYSILYFFISLYAYKFIKKGNLGIDTKTNKPAKFPHVQFFISIYITIGEIIITYCVRNLSSVFTCIPNGDLISNAKTVTGYNCLTGYHFLFIYLSFAGLVGFFLFALVFWPNFQFYQKLLDIKFYAYYIIFNLFFDGIIIVIENFIGDDIKTINNVLFLTIIDISIILVRIFILYFYKPCIIKDFNYFEIFVTIIELLPFVFTVILYFTRNSILTLIGLVISIVIYIGILIFKKLNKIKKN